METAYLIVDIHRQNDRNHPMGYPALYDAQEVEAHRVGPIVYEGAMSRGEDVEECLLCVSRQLAESYATDPEGRMRVITESEADVWLQANRQLAERMPEERVDDEGRMLAIIAKCLAAQAAPGVLSQEDLDALDPDRPVRGIRRQRRTARGVFHGER